MDDAVSVSTRATASKSTRQLSPPIPCTLFMRKITYTVWKCAECLSFQSNKKNKFFLDMGVSECVDNREAALDLQLFSL